MSIYEFIISVFLIIEQFYSAIVIQPLRSRGFPPALSDIEMLTIQIVGEFLGLDSDKISGSTLNTIGLNGFQN